MKEKNCPTCKKLFFSKNNRKTYCNPNCSYRMKPKPYIENLSRPTIGAISELEVSSLLLRNGYEVLRALSPSATRDIVAIKNEKFYDFEVRTAYKNANESIGYSKENIRANYVAAYLLEEKKLFIFDKNGNHLFSLSHTNNDHTVS